MSIRMAFASALACLTVVAGAAEMKEMSSEKPGVGIWATEGGWLFVPTNRTDVRYPAKLTLFNPGTLLEKPNPSHYNDRRVEFMVEVGEPDGVARALAGARILKARPEWNGRDLDVKGSERCALAAVALAAEECAVTHLDLDLGRDCAGFRFGGRDILSDAGRLGNFCTVSIIFSGSTDDAVNPPPAVMPLYKALKVKKGYIWKKRGDKDWQSIADGGHADGPWPKEPVVACEQMSGRYVILDGSEGAKPRYVWEWAPEGDPNVSKKDRGLFAYPSECKVRDGGRSLLIVASGGGAALIDVKTRRAKWYGHVTGNPHSVEILPDGKVIVASSDNGDKLVIFDPRKEPFDPAKQNAKLAWELKSAHGVVWDAKRDCLWALCKTMLYQFAYDRATSELKELRSWDFHKDRGIFDGHDLSIDGKGGFFFTTKECITHFDPETGVFEKARDHGNVKAFTHSATLGDLYAIPNDRWYTDRLLVERGGKSWTVGPVPGARFYKARWMEELK